MPNPKGNPATLKPFAATWRSGPTQVIRIPAALTDQVLAYARSLDTGEMPTAQQPIDSQSLLQVIEKLKVLYETPRNNFSRDRKALLQSVISELESLVTRDIV